MPATISCVGGARAAALGARAEGADSAGGRALLGSSQGSFARGAALSVAFPKAHTPQHRLAAQAAAAPAGNSESIGGDAPVGKGFKPGSSISTIALHGGEGKDGRPKTSDMLTTPICCTSTFTFRNTQELIEFNEGTFKSFEYGRYGNPTTRTCEEKIRDLEGAEDCLLSSSGMNSATTMLLALVPPNGHIVTTTDCYRRTRQFIQTMLPRMGITCTVIDPADYDGLEKALKEHDVTLYFSESPTNPYLRVIDVPRVAELCHAHGAVVCIDGTFSTPVNQQAIKLGADLVLTSATKYLAGHNDVLAGALAGKADLIADVRHFHNILGGVVDPHAAYLVLRGIKTLALRVEKQNKSAQKLAELLEAHPKVLAVHYPGLESHPEHEIAKAQMKGFGGVVSFQIDGDLMTTAKFIDNNQIPYIAPSLGGVESLIEQPAVISYWDQGAEKRAELGILDNLVRYSVGIEDWEDIEADVLQALDTI